MRLITNPLVVRMAIVFVAGAFAFMVGFFAIRQLRQGLQEDTMPAESKTFADNFPLHTYHAVIQQLKQQKHELQALQQSERRRAQTTENVSAAVLSNLSCGVLFLNNNALVRQANTAAKNILGIASPLGMSPRELFRDARVQGGLNSERTPLAEAITASLKSFSKFERLEANYVTPKGAERILEVTVSPVYGANAEVLGAACLISDCTELLLMRRGQNSSPVISPEIVMQLKDSLSDISAQAMELSTTHDQQTAHKLATEIAGRADRLQEKISGLPSRRSVVGTASGTN